jgi:predicted aspartyl protease
MSFTIGKTLFNRMEKAGVEFIDLNKKVVSQGIGGVSNGKKIILNNIKIGDYFLNNVVATVSLDNNYSLLGTGFLLKFKNAIWKMQQNKLLLYK